MTAQYMSAYSRELALATATRSPGLTPCAVRAARWPALPPGHAPLRRSARRLRMRENDPADRPGSGAQRARVGAGRTPAESGPAPRCAATRTAPRDRRCGSGRRAPTAGPIRTTRGGSAAVRWAHEQCSEAGARPRPAGRCAGARTAGPGEFLVNRRPATPSGTLGWGYTQHVGERPLPGGCPRKEFVLPAHKPSTDATRRRIEAVTATLPMHDQQDFEDARRGLVGRAEERVVTASDGRVVWDLDAYDFLRDGDAPDTANPSLWRQGQLLIEDGLFEVVPGIYQLRGFDLSVMTVVEGETGVIVIDPLVVPETAAAAFALYRAHRGQRPVRAMIYTHSHVDHFGGVKGIITEEQVASGDPGHRPRGIPASCDGRERVRRDGDGAARRLHVRRRAAEGARPGRSVQDWARRPRPARSTLIAPTSDITTTGQQLTSTASRSCSR